MVARSLDDVREAFVKDEKLAAAFGRTFIEAYGATAFGVLPKKEMDLLVFSFLVRSDVIDANGPMYRIARALNVTPAKAKALLFEYQLRNVSEAQTDHAVMIAITTARYWKDGAHLSFGIASPLVKAAIAAKMQEGGVFADVSLSGEILKVNPEHFGRVLSDLVSKTQSDRLLAHLKKKKVLEDKDLRAALAAQGKKYAMEAVEKGASKGLETMLAGLGGFFSGTDGAADFLEDLF